MRRGNSFAASLLMALSFACGASAAPVHIYALVVGADHYQSFATLRGAVNDANLLARTFREAGVDEVDTLVESQVTREAIFNDIKALIARSRPGDWVIFTYAGHGGRERLDSAGEWVSTFLLPGYRNSAPANGQRIINHELKLLFGSAPQVNFIFVADACHSRSMVRSWDARATPPATRAAGDYGPIDDVLTPPTVADGPRGLPNVIFVSAAGDEQDAPEIPFADGFHGAVSVYFAKVLRGDASGGRTARLSDLQQFIDTGAQEASGSRQIPDVTFAESRAAEVLPFPRVAPSNSQRPEGPQQTAIYLADGGNVSQLTDVRLVVSKSDADFIWDADAGTVVDGRLGDLVAENVTSSTLLQGVVDKWRALAVLDALSAQHPLHVDVAPHSRGALYHLGQEVDISISQNSMLPFLTLVDLASTGVVQSLSRASDDERAVRCLRSNVVPPLGADHVIAIATAERPDGLRAALAGIDQRPEARRLAEILTTSLRTADYALGIGPLYTSAGSLEISTRPAPGCL